MASDINSLVDLVRIRIDTEITGNGKLAVIESYARVLNQLLEAKQREVNIEHMQANANAKTDKTNYEKQRELIK